MLRAARRSRVIAILVFILISGFVTQSAIGQAVATADIHNADGDFIALAILTQIGDQVEVTVKASDLEPGMHGTHIHEVGSCDAPDFTSAGAHFGPLGEDADLNPHGSYAGDLPDMEVDENGEGTLQYSTELISLTDGEFNLFDADGSAIVIHALPTDDEGNAGARVACGVIVGMQDTNGAEIEEPSDEREVVTPGSFSFGTMELVLSLAALIVLAVIVMRVL